MQRLGRECFSKSAISRITGIPRSTVRDWLNGSRYERRIELADRQAEITESFPREFVRGRLFCDHLDLLGIEWRRATAKNISIARREAVAALDAFVGPKY